MILLLLDLWVLPPHHFRTEPKLVTPKVEKKKGESKKKSAYPKLKTKDTLNNLG